MGKNNRIEPADIFAQHLNSKFRRGVHHQFRPLRRDVDRWARAMVFRIADKLSRIFLADYWNPLRRPCAQKNKRKRHAPPNCNGWSNAQATVNKGSRMSRAGLVTKSCQTIVGDDVRRL